MLVTFSFVYFPGVLLTGARNLLGKGEDGNTKLSKGELSTFGMGGDISEPTGVVPDLFEPPDDSVAKEGDWSSFPESTTIPFVKVDISQPFLSITCFDKDWLTDEIAPASLLLENVSPCSDGCNSGRAGKFQEEDTLD
jgi:hypothetical protein